MEESNLDDTVYQDAVSFTRPYNTLYPQIDSSIVKTPTILQKLPDNSLSSLNFNTIQQQRKQAEKQEAVLAEPLPTSTPSILRDASFKILQTKLSLKQQRKEEQEELERIKNLDRPMYYKPPSSNFKDSFYGIKECIPPNVKLLDQEVRSTKQTKSTIPIFVNYEATKQNPKEILQSIRDEFDEADLDDSVGDDNPSGSWENPIVKKALSRQIDLEYQLKILLKNVLYLLIFSFFRTSISKLVCIYQLKLKTTQHPAFVQQETSSSTSLEFYLLLLTKVVVVYFIFNIVIPLVRLLKGQDQCYDLPLSMKQRKLLGLKVKDVPEDYVIDEEAELTLKQRRYDVDNEDKKPYKPIPKYNKLNDYSVFNISKKNVPELVKNQSLYQVRKDDPAALSNQSAIGVKFLRNKSRDNMITSKYSTETINKAQNKFEKNFDIKFNFT